MIVDIVDKYLADDNNPIKNLRLKVVVYSPAEKADTFLLFLLYPYMYSVCALQLVHTISMMYITEEEMYTVKKG